MLNASIVMILLPDVEAQEDESYNDDRFKATLLKQRQLAKQPSSVKRERPRASKEATKSFKRGNQEIPKEHQDRLERESTKIASKEQPRASKRANLLDEGYH
jgi:hypothetical protein